MQTQTPAPPAPPAPEPVTVQTPGTRTTTRTATNVVVSQGGGTVAIPRTREEYRALETRQREVGSQLTSAANRRKSVAMELEKAHDPANQNGLQQRLQVLDNRVARLETELDEVGRALASAPYSALPSSARTEVAAGGGRGMTEAAQIVSVVVPSSLFFVLAIVGLSMWFKRNRGGPGGAGARTKAEIERLDRLEQAVETIAVEMERVSEGQRFVTRILTEGKAGQAPVFGNPRQAEALPVSSRSDQNGH